MYISFVYTLHDKIIVVKHPVVGGRGSKYCISFTPVIFSCQLLLLLPS